jgi:retinol dehydrogenase 12
MTAMSMASVDFDRLADGSVTANCLEPGPALSQFGRGASGTLGLVARLVRVAAFLGLVGSTEDGARTPIYLASSPDVAELTGRYFRKCREVRAKAISDDRAVVQRFWDESEHLCSSSGSVLEPRGVRAFDGLAMPREST